MRKPWSAKERAHLRKLWPDMPAKQVAEAMGRSLSAIHNQAHQMGLKKSPEFLRAMVVWTTKNPCKFEKGFTPWNKGKTGVNGYSATRFKSGQLNGRAAKLVKPLGSYRIIDGNLEMKVSKQTGPSSLRWRPVHQMVWEMENGNVPKGSLVVFKPGQHTTKPEEITLDRLECITRAENMSRNTYHRYPKEIAKLIQLRGALSRQINKRANENHR